TTKNNQALCVTFSQPSRKADKTIPLVVVTIRTEKFLFPEGCPRLQPQRARKYLLPITNVMSEAHKQTQYRHFVLWHYVS
ncbi:hypothetical protein, partial [Vibrio anguillarum]|uniref:hypothetical protein n=1 Tax=Vibrio anguillarum TaxID=55601 RepID=UPI001BE46F23